MSSPMYVRVRGTVVGPLSSDQIGRMWESGQLQPFHEVSTDGQSWSPAATMIGPDGRRKVVREGRPNEQPEHAEFDLPAPACRRSRLPAAQWVVLGIALVLLVGGIGGILLFKKFGNNSSGERIIGLNDEDRLKRALGLVVCGMEVTLPDGEIVEELLSTGTCFSVTADGLMVTNAHVIEDIANAQRSPRLRRLEREKDVILRPQVWVFLGKGKKLLAEIVYVSENHDLGLLRIPCNDCSYFTLTSEERLRRRDPVYAYGFPGAARMPVSEEEWLKGAFKRVEPKIETQFKDRDFEFSVTSGVVSQVTTEAEGRRWVLHDASLSGGNSGGPLLNEAGLVVGLNTLRHPDGDNMFFSLSIPQLREEISRYSTEIRWE